MSVPPEQPQSSPRTLDGPPKATLEGFIEAHSKLVTSIAAFIAITAFSSQIDDTYIRLWVSGLAFLIAVLLGIELLMLMPPQPHQWRLVLFVLALAEIVFAMAWYWFSKFPTIWAPFVWVVLQVVIFFGLVILLTQAVTKLIKLVAIYVFKKELSDKDMLKVLKIVAVSSMILVTVGAYWTLYKLAGHTFSITIPTGLRTLFEQIRKISATRIADSWSA
jgi:hypothetical protein